MPNKFSVFIAMNGYRDAVVSYFANNGVLYLFSIEDYIPLCSLEAGSSDEVILGVAREAAERLVLSRGDNESIVDVDEVYEFIVEGEQIGWEVVINTTVDDDLWLLVDDE